MGNNKINSFEDSLFNKEQLEILLNCSKIKNTTEWNKWRDNHPQIEVNLQGAPLDNTYLKNANLHHANLKDASLNNVDLENSQLYFANLENANLLHANLRNTKLSYANLKKTFWLGSNLNFAELNNADLKEARVIFTSFQGAILIEVNLECSEFNNNNLSNTNLMKAILKNTKLVEVNLEGTDLTGANLEGASLRNANLEKAKLNKTILNNAFLNSANLKKARIINADLDNANLNYANLEGAIIAKSRIRGTAFMGSKINSCTSITTSIINKKTDFTSVALDSARIEPSLLVALKTNIRRIAWNKYYDEQGKSLWGNIKIAPIRLFWWLSDYGSNTARIFKVFLSISVIFTLIYLMIAYFNPDPAVLSNFRITANWWLNVISAFCFAVSTMVTLGFGGINVTIQESAPWATFFALFFVTFNLMIGYFILAVLVTRLGILFQSLAPEQKIKKE